MVLTALVNTVVLSILFNYPYSALGGAVQSGTPVPANYQGYADKVKQIFVNSYSAYEQYAYGHDDLNPVSESAQDDRNGFGATIFDAMTTMYIMGLTDQLNNATAFAFQVDFSQSHTPSTISIFETTIRYLGAMMSYTDLASNTELVGQNNIDLVGQARTLADNMAAVAWSSNNVIPYPEVVFGSSSDSQSDDSSNVAEAGSLALEWSTLSKYAQDSKYADLAVGALRHIAALPNPPLLGLPAQSIIPSSGETSGAYVTWGGGTDSYLEYLIKYARLSNSDDSIYVDTWKAAVDSSIRVLMRNSTSADGNHVYIADWNDGQILHVGSNLECFHGGNWILGGKMTNNETIVNYGLALVDACWNTYSSTATKIGPESFAYESSDGNFTGSSGPSDAEQAYFNQHGYYITDSHYYMRPEVLESNFYAWRATGDTKYLDNAVSFVDSIMQYLPAEVGYAGLDDVNSKNSAKDDNMPSFWFAEVLKYLYLTFDDPSHISLDQYVFNTEAHPLWAPPAKAVY
ncbi:glycoside hydrolase family 47 protein [Rhodocollybia butyracea]|uniref:alpha-1,2-Mannosidase n=1 Tax=Rhodocollybia butyracea TaxID=206335 RepID=A0A9P5QBD4_9AGAR|nr:glycoside hydrolase family 47 protein [Rhodocollybia butyracea]